MYQQTIAKIESGQRAVRLQEADIIARALESSVSDLLSEAIRAPNSSPEEMEIDELLTLLRATTQRLESAADTLDLATRDEAVAQGFLSQAQHQALISAAKRQQALATVADIKAERDYLTRSLLRRRREVKELYGPRWKGVFEEHGVSTLGIPNGDERHEKAYHDFLRKAHEYAESTNISEEEKSKLRSEIDDLKRELDEARKAAEDS